MATWKNRWPDNVGGTNEVKGKKYGFYVDKDCILCSVCSDAAPNNFRLSKEEDHDVCFKQPTTEQEVKECIEAMEGCPVEAIGSDGQ